VRWIVLCVLFGCWRGAEPPRQPAVADEAPPDPQPTFQSRHARTVSTPHDKLLAALDELRGIADQFCACSDPKCTQNVMSEMQRWSEEIQGDPDLKDIHPTAEDQQLQAEITKQLSDCLMRSMGSPPQAPQTQP
jgi:hypothetical protein